MHMGGGSLYQLYDVPVHAFNPTSSHSMHIEPFSLLSTGKDTVTNPTTNTLANKCPLPLPENSRSGHVGVNQKGIFGYSCPDDHDINKSKFMTDAIPPSKQSIGL